MIRETISFLREQLERSSGCPVLAADLARDNLDPPNALVLSLLHTKQIQALQNRRGPRGTELSILLSSYFADYSAALSALDSAIGWTEQHAVLNAEPGRLSSGGAQVSIVVTEMAMMELVALWRSLTVPPLPSLVLSAKVLAER